MPRRKDHCLQETYRSSNTQNQSLKLSYKLHIHTMLGFYLVIRPSGEIDLVETLFEFEQSKRTRINKEICREIKDKGSKDRSAQAIKRSIEEGGEGIYLSARSNPNGVLLFGRNNYSTSAVSGKFLERSLEIN
jgi:hypothetical protein